MTLYISPRPWLRALLALVMVAVVLAAGRPAHAGGIVYVVPGGAGAKDGSSWANAKDLAAALSGANSGDELWVSKGTYKPTTGTDRNATFTLNRGVAVYGGFGGNETQRSQRNWQANVTTLTGDLNGDDGPNFANNGDNSYRVVTATSADNTTVLDGFTITGGNATDRQGGGMYSNGDTTLANLVFAGNFGGNGGGGMLILGSPTLTNVTFTGNKAGGSGGGLLNLGNVPTLTNVTFSNNTATSDGGGMFNNGSSPTLTGVTFTGNTALNGGGMANNTNTLTLINVVFSGNSATSVNQYTGFGGGMYSNGGTATLVSVVFSGNVAANGGGIANHGSSPTLTNVTLSGNNASSGGGMYNNTPDQYAGASSPVIRNSIFWGDVGGEIAGPGATVTNSDVQQASGVYVGAGNINADPLFVSPIAAPAPTATGNLRLQANSPAINKGDNSSIPTSVTTDPDGNARIIGAAVDMGAYEALCPADTPPTLVVNASVSGGLGNGEGWANAAPSLAFALARAGACSAVTQIWVAKGTYKPARPGGDRQAAFQLRSNLAVYGGFTAGQTLLSQRDPKTNVTTLSGDLNGDDGPNFANNGDNSYHVVTGSGTDNTAILDGFTISGGNANASYYPANVGGGMFNVGSTTLTNLTFSGNSALVYGGGIYSLGAATLNSVVLSGNSAAFGGGMYSTGNATLTNIMFSGNSSSFAGGGMVGVDSPKLTNVTFRGNSAGGNGAGLFLFTSSPTLTNVVFSGNYSSGYGGAMYSGSNCSPVLTNVTFNGNSAGQGGGAMYNDANSAAQLRNSLAWGDTGGEIVNASNSNTMVTYTDVQQAAGVYPGTGNINADPLFIAPITVAAPTTTGNLRLGPGSPAINAGDNDFVPADVTTDLDGNPRIIATGTKVDMGAYEVQDTVKPTLNPTFSPSQPVVGSPATASPNATDNYSGIASQSCDPVDTSSIGTRSLTCRATDNAGNTNSVQVSYTVGYRVSYVSPTVGPPSVNNIYPTGLAPWYTTAKWRMTNGSGAAITTGVVAAVRFTPMTCGAALPAYSDGYPMAGGYSTTNPRYDTLQAAWLFNWQLPTAKGCYALYARYANGQIVPFLYRTN